MSALDDTDQIEAAASDVRPVDVRLANMCPLLAPASLNAYSDLSRREIGIKRLLLSLSILTSTLGACFESF